MKKILLAILFLVFLMPATHEVLAQLVEPPHLVVGAKGGASATDMLYTKNAYSIYTHSPLIDYFGGAFVKFRVNHRYGILLDLQYNGDGTNMKWADVNYTLHRKYLDVRFLQLFHFGDRRNNFTPYFGFGPALGISAGGDITYFSEYTPQFTTPITGGSFAKFDGGVYVGLGFDYQFAFGMNMNVVILSLEAGYRCGLLNTFTKYDKSDEALILNPEFDAPLYEAQRLSQGVEVSLRLGIPIRLYKDQPRVFERPELFPLELDDDEDTIEVPRLTPRFYDYYEQKECYTLGEIRDMINHGEEVSGLRICLFNILFDFDKSEIRPEAQRIIADLATLMRKYPSIIIKVNGHTDSDGSDEYNQALSERRAKAVKYAIQEYGILGERIKWQGFGEKHPIDSNDTTKGRARNRRVEIDILTVPQSSR